MTLLETLDFTAKHLADSMRWLRITNVLMLAAVVVAVVSGWQHRREALALRASGAADPGQTSGATKLCVGLVVAAMLCCFTSVGYRWIEVNHFPSQTMNEVLVMTSLALLVSLVVLHFALRWRDHGPGWAIFGDALFAIVLFGTFMLNYYSSSLSTAERDLPPALQSYWFAPHLSALIFSYATLTIAGVLCAVYFSIRFWSVLRHGGRSWASQLLILAALVLVPFTHFVTLPLLLLVGAVLFLAGGARAMPQGPGLSALEVKLEAVSHRAFAVGFPFLTAGLFMGAFWAQEAWANYWGWDSKENSALITWLIYVIYIHLRMLGGYRGEKAMGVLMAGALSVFVTFQIFGYLPDSQKSLHRYTDDGVVPVEGMQGAQPVADQSARLEPRDE